ncbi:MAG: hypothetical protein M1341_02575 [Candidatus Thermoplasmatota archaeon]|nr:hypothetical protein [Candidatus Thermoplasmatota archaeon]
MTAGSFPELILLSTIMGFSIFLSLPVIFARNIGSKTITTLTAIAVGILVFLLADVFSDVTGNLYPGGSYVANPAVAFIFLAGAGGSFAVLLLLQGRKTDHDGAVKPMHISVIVAIAIGFQNLTEGLVFGANWNTGLYGFVLVIFVGFILQNFTEGFPIVSPFLGGKAPRIDLLILLFLIGALPTIAGALSGYYLDIPYLNVAFDSLAIGSIFYIILPMLNMVFSQSRNQVQGKTIYTGLITGFLLGFLVNVI